MTNLTKLAVSVTPVDSDLQGFAQGCEDALDGHCLTEELCLASVPTAFIIIAHILDDLSPSLSVNPVQIRDLYRAWKHRDRTDLELGSSQQAPRTCYDRSACAIMRQIFVSLTLYSKQTGH